MTDITDKIRAALDAKTAAYDTDTLFVFDNVPGAPAVSQTYVEVSFAPTSKRPAVRGPNPQHRYQGLYQLTVCTPKGTGPGAAFQLAAALCDYMPGSSTVDGVDVNVSIEYSEARQGYPDGNFFRVPVQVAWYAYA